MNTNKFLRILCSLPVIFISLYFVPFLGICLVVLRQFIYKNQKQYKTSISIIILGVLIFIPQVLHTVLDMINQSIPYLNDIIKSNNYIELLDYAKFLLILGVILLIISSVLKSTIEKIQSYATKYMTISIDKSVQAKREIVKENDMEMKIKQEKAQNTGYVKCPNCGSDNLVSDKVGTCKFCRSKLVNNAYKNI